VGGVVNGKNREAVLKAPASWMQGDPRRAGCRMADGRISKLTIGPGKDWISEYKGASSKPRVVNRLENLRPDAPNFLEGDFLGIWLVRSAGVVHGLYA
jgi:hypothetical protein